MTKVAIVPEPSVEGITVYRAVAGSRQAVAKTVGGALDALIVLSAIMHFPSTPALAQGTNRTFDRYTLDFTTPRDAALQAKLEAVDARLRERYGMPAIRRPSDSSICRSCGWR